MLQLIAAARALSSARLRKHAASFKDFHLAAAPAFCVNTPQPQYISTPRNIAAPRTAETRYIRPSGSRPLCCRARAATVCPLFLRAAPFDDAPGLLGPV